MVSTAGSFCAAEILSLRFLVPTHFSLVCLSLPPSFPLLHFPLRVHAHICIHTQNLFHTLFPLSSGFSDLVVNLPLLSFCVCHLTRRGALVPLFLCLFRSGRSPSFLLFITSSLPRRAHLSRYIPHHRVFARPSPIGQTISRLILRLLAGRPLVFFFFFFCFLVDKSFFLSNPSLLFHLSRYLSLSRSTFLLFIGDRADRATPQAYLDRPQVS